MRFGIDDTPECIAVVAQLQRPLHRAHIASLIISRHDGRAYRMNEARIPLGGEPSATRARIASQPFVLLHVLRDAELPGLASANLVINVLHQAPAIGDIIGRIVITSEDIPYPAGSIPAKPIHETLLHPAQRIVPKVLPHFVSAVIRPVHPPGSLFAVVVIKIDAALVVLAPAIELPQIAIVWTDMVINHVEKNRDTALVRFPHQIAKSVGASVGMLYREHISLVVAPGGIGWKFPRGHDLDHVDAQIPQIV